MVPVRGTGELLGAYLGCELTWAQDGFIYLHLYPPDKRISKNIMLSFVIRVFISRLKPCKSPFGSTIG